MEWKKTENNTLTLPPVGLGTWQLNARNGFAEVISAAWETGYRLFDLAAAYSNEIAFRKALAETGIRREELLLSDKVWNTYRGCDAVREACKASLHKLKTDYIDLYLVHWPASPALHEDWRELNADTWRGMESLLDEGLVRHVGVCNFKPHHLEELKKTARIMPAVNQFEFHPGYWQRENYDYCRAQGILMEGSSPLGTGEVLQNETLQCIAAAKGKSAAQVCLRWANQKGVVVIPKTAHAERLRENMDIFDFTLSDDEIRAIDAVPFCGGLADDADEVTRFG